MYNNPVSVKPIVIAVLSVVALIVIISLLPFTIIGAGERGVVTKFGKVQPYILDEGFHFLTPFQDRVTKVSVRVQKAEITATAASGDLQTVSTKIIVNYHLRPDRVNRIYQEIGSEKDVVDRILNPNTNEVLKASTAQKTAEELLTKRAALKQTIDIGLTERLKPYYIVLDDVSIVDIDFSPEFNQAIEAKAKAVQEALKAQNDLKRVEFESQQAVTRAKAEAESRTAIAAAEAKAIQIKGDALRENPSLVSLTAVEKWNGVLPVNMYGSAPLPFITVQ